MKRPVFPLHNRIRKIAISRKLYLMIGVMAILLVLEFFTIWFVLTALSSTRAFVNGEGLWSKHQKNAVVNLLLYARSHNEMDYRQYTEYLNIPLADHKARLALLQQIPDYQVARENLIAGMNKTEDVDGIIMVLTRFRNISFVRNAVSAWEEADNKLEELIATGDQLHVLISSGQVSQQSADVMFNRIEALNKELTQLENNFSTVMGEGSRWLERTALIVLLVLSLIIGLIIVLITTSVSRGVVKGVKEITRGIDLVGNGLLDTRVKVYADDEIGKLATAFNQMIETLEHHLNHIQELKDAEANLRREKERVEGSQKSKQLFLAKMSHEIRTPLNAILGFARLLQESLTGKEQQEYMRVIIKSGDSLLVILNDILDFSRIEAGKVVFEYTYFNPGDAAVTIKRMMEPKAKQKGLVINCDVDKNVPVKVLGDSVRLKQVLLNLVSNAINFTNEGEVNITVTCIEDTDAQYKIRFGVKDTGIGIPVEHQKRIFESFEQGGDVTAYKTGGIGLGLSIVKQLIALQHGELFVDSEPGTGAHFYFILSFARQTGAAKENGTATPGILPELAKRIRVLVVEDNIVNQKLVIKVLQKKGFETFLAENGRVALECYEREDFDVILMDLQMPEMNGYEATQKIRALHNYKKDIPIIGLTAHAFKEERQRCLDLGMNDFVPKPFDSADLYERIFAQVGDGTA